MGQSKLIFHQFKHNFKDTINPISPVNDAIEDKEHFLLLSDSFRERRCSLLVGVNDVPEDYGYFKGGDTTMLHILQYGNKNLPLEANKIILNLTMKYISGTEGFG